MTKQKRKSFTAKRDAETFLLELRRPTAKLYKRDGLGYVVIWTPDEERLDHLNLDTRSSFEKWGGHHTPAVEIPLEPKAQLRETIAASIKEQAKQNIVGDPESALQEISALKYKIETLKCDLYSERERYQEKLIISQKELATNKSEKTSIINSYIALLDNANVQLSNIDAIVEERTKHKNGLLALTIADSEEKGRRFQAQKDNVYREAKALIDLRYKQNKQQLLGDVMRRETSLDIKISETANLNKLINQNLEKERLKLIKLISNAEAMYEECRQKIDIMDCIERAYIEVFGKVRIEKIRDDIVDKSICRRCDGSGGHNLGCIICNGTGMIQEIRKVATYKGYLDDY